MKEQNIFHICLLILITCSIAYLMMANKTENIPSVFFSGIAAFFGFHAYRFSKERFRLDLLDKRWIIYEQTLKFCSTVMTYGGLPGYKEHPDYEHRNDAIKNALISAHDSFRGIGYHKTRSLFGDDIHKCFEKLNNSYSWLVSRQNVSVSQAAEEAEKENEHLKFIWDTVNTLPDLFKPYVYFGEYRWDT